MHVFGPEYKDTVANQKEIIVVNKSDLINARSSGAIYVSAMTGDGIPELLELIKNKMHEELDYAENDLALNERTKRHLEQAIVELKKVSGMAVDLQSEHIMNAADEIGQVLGIIGSEDIYDSVFGQLCLGK